MPRQICSVASTPVRFPHPSKCASARYHSLGARALQEAHPAVARELVRLVGGRFESLARQAPVAAGGGAAGGWVHVTSTPFDLAAVVAELELG